MTESDIQDAQEEMENYVEGMQAFVENSIENMHMMGFDNLKETMDHANQVAQNLSEGEDIKEVDLGEYKPYLSYTYEDIAACRQQGGGTCDHGGNPLSVPIPHGYRDF